MRELTVLDNEIYEMLTNAEAFGDVKIFHLQSDTVVEYPSMTFICENINGSMVFEGLGSQEIYVLIDIWTESVDEGNQLLVALDSEMLSNKYIRDFARPIPNIGKAYHIATRYKFIK